MPPATAPASPRIALLHHWFVTRGGGERVAECLAALLPTADIFTLVSTPEGVPASLAGRTIQISFLQKIPGAAHNHRHMMPLYPEAARSLDLRGYDLVVSSDSAAIKAARLNATAQHLCYCHSPMRYLYDSYESYRAGMDPITRAIFTLTAPRVRRADLAAAKRVSRFVANSHYVAERIRSVYSREARVVHPPIDLHRARLNPHNDAYLAAGRLVQYKRTDLMIEACRMLGRKLRIAGAGPEEPRLRKLAAGADVTFLGALSTDDLWNEYSRARALLFAADEDFGMVPLEAQSCGRPVIAYGHGGSLETVRGNTNETAPTGVFFPEQTAASLADAILSFEAREESFAPAAAQQHAADFATPIFLEHMRAEIAAMSPAADALMPTAAEAAETVR